MSPSTEQELLDCTIDLAYRMGWRVHHDRPARTARGWRTAVQGNIGFPDLVLARRGVVLFRELKGPRGRLAREQRDWGAQIFPATAPLYSAQRRGFIAPQIRMSWLFDVWTPEDFEPLIVPTLTARVAAHA